MKPFPEKEDLIRINMDIPTELMREIGLTYFSYGLIAEGEVLFSYFTHKEWGDLYQEKHYQEIDPLLRGVIHSHFPLIIWDALHSSGRERELMAERNMVCRLKSGLTVGLTNKGYTELVALGSEISPQEFYSLLKDKEYTDKIREIVATFYNAASQQSLLLKS